MSEVPWLSLTPAEKDRMSYALSSLANLDTSPKNALYFLCGCLEADPTTPALKLVSERLCLLADKSVH